MTRAGVFVGVDQTGNLQKLNDAASGAARMYQWALAQNMAGNAKLITDADGARVTPDMIFDAIKAIIDGPGVDQLILYFAGHGVNINRGEQWLLTDAPGRPNAAVNVSGSVELARYCGIQHVVLISDACRVAPDGIQAQSVRGSEVFPNEGAGDRAKPVDQFFACLLGKTAAELKDPASAAANFTALYTDALLAALVGERPEILEPGSAGDTAMYLRPRKLEGYLEIEVPSRVRARNLEHKVNQNPDAIITSDAAWLARFDPPPAPEIPVSRGPAGPLLPSLESVALPPRTLGNVARDLIRSAASDKPAEHDLQLTQSKAESVPGASGLAVQAERLAAPFGPDHFESECGIKIRGNRIVEFFAPRAQGLDSINNGELLRVHTPEPPAISVLLRFEGGVGALIPVFPGFLAALTFDDGELVDVAYEPSANTWRWSMYADHAANVRALRAVAAASSQQGRFRLDQADALAVAQRMQFAKGIDPTLAVYAAYAYHDLGEDDRIRNMSSFLQGDVGATFFDLALLGRALRDKSVGPKDGIVPFVPLLSQGWALLRANNVKLHSQLDGIEQTMRDSLWSLFDVTGMGQLKNALHTGEVR